MLVPLVLRSWPKEKRRTIISRMRALADAQGQTLEKNVTAIGSLGDGEELWLYSHGSSSTFGGMTDAELAGLLIDKVKMPAGARKIVLKGCKTAGYAASLQEIINDATGYEGVIVVGFEGEASYTDENGRMTIRSADRAQHEKAKRLGALEEIRIRRDAAGNKRRKVNVDQEAAEARAQVEKDALRLDTAYDEGSHTYVGTTERWQRRENRARSGTQTLPKQEKPQPGSDNSDGDTVI